MTDRQRDLFLYQWSRRRTPGGVRISLRGALIGALGGAVFAMILLGDGAGRPPGVAAYDYTGQMRAAFSVFAASVPAFAAIGWAGAWRVWRSNENMYQAILQSGARVPDQKPQLSPSERGPMIAVIATVVIIAGLIAWLFWAANTGRL